MSVMEHLIGALMYGSGAILLLLLTAAIVVLSTYLTADYIRDRRR